MSWKKTRKYFDFDEKAIAAGEISAWELIQPLWYTVSIYDGLAQYEQDLKPFSGAQRRLLALFWYDAEVCNGGHDQFFSNSTGIVWKDALDGLRMIGADEYAANLQKAVDRFGGAVPFARDARIAALESLYRDEAFDDFREMDTFYYGETCIQARMQAYVQQHAADFAVKGEYPYYENVTG